MCLVVCCVCLSAATVTKSILNVSFNPKKLTWLAIAGSSRGIFYQRFTRQHAQRALY